MRKGISTLSNLGDGNTLWVPRESTGSTHGKVFYGLRYGQRKKINSHIRNILH